MKKALVFAALAAVVSSPALAAPDSSNAVGSAKATVVGPITLTHDANAVLSFGSFTTGTNGGSVIVTKAGNGSATGDVTLVAGSVESADSFTVTGDSGRAFQVTTFADVVSFGGTDMAFVPNATKNQTLTGGSVQFSVGGTLTVPGGAPAGDYVGTYDVTAAYN
ncbi:MAG: DUF4402 domain-containing protein [Novosphingobium sp.]